MRPLPLLAIATLLFPIATFAADTNLIHNPGFETLDAATNVPQEWTPTYWSNPKGKIEAADEAHSGAHSLKITGLPRERITDIGKHNNHLCGQELGDRLQGPCRVTLRVWIKTAGTGSAYCSIMSKGRDGGQVQYLSSRAITGQPDWAELVWNFTTDPETQNATLYLRNAGEDAVWFDDISLVAASDMLDNDFARVMVDPLVGGRIRSYVLKPAGREVTMWEGVRPGGLAADIAPAEEYPGLLRDAPCTMEALEPRRKVLLRHEPAGGSLAGLLFEKEVRLVEGSASVEVVLRVKNTAAETRRVSLRAQQCLPPADGDVFSWPAKDGVRILPPDPVRLKASVDITDLREGWLACTNPDSHSGLVTTFDLKQTTKALIYLSPELNTLEWYYKAFELPANGTWETTYLIAPVASGAPIVGVAQDVAFSLSPAKFPAPQDHALTLCPLRGPRDVSLQFEGKVAGKTTTVTSPLKLTAHAPTPVPLPWKGPRLEQLRLSLGQPPQTVTLAAALINDKPLHDLPPPPERVAWPALAGFFPYGEYYRGYTGPEMGTQQAATARQLRTYRRAYLNSYIVGEGMCLGPMKAGQTPWVCDLARQYHMRLIPKGDVLRRFDRGADGRQVELPAPPGTREAMLQRFTESGFDLDLRRAFAQKYGDLILAYDMSDEPGSEHVPAYVQLQAMVREADPAHPVLVILNLNRTEYLPYMPVYYGDEYPITITGRRPWYVAERVRFCAQKTPAPVWVMLQAFGGREDYTWQLPNAAETRLTIWLVVANGGKGITWHGSQSPPCWRVNQHYFTTLCDSWGAATPGWAALRDAGRQVTAIGPALLQTDYVADHPFTVDTEQLDLGKSMYQGPAVTLGVLKQRAGGGTFIVAVNEDIAKERQTTLHVDAAKAAGMELCDLQELKSLGPAATAPPQFTLAPGDGRIFFCGPPEAAKAALAAVHRGHYDNERVIYDMDAGVATANGVDIAAAAELSRQAAAAYEKGDYTTAHERLTGAQAKLAAAVAAAQPLATVLSQLQEALGLLSEVAAVYRENFDVLVPPDLYKQSPRGAAFVNKQDPKLQQFVDQTAEAFCQRLLLEDGVHAGQAQALAAKAAQLLAEAKRLRAEAIPYVRGKAAGPQ